MVKRIFCYAVFVFILVNLNIYAENSNEDKKIVVYVDMVADLFHAGHVAFLKKARSCGDYLIVGIHDDKTVESYKRSPICNLQERLDVIEACKYVDEIIAAAPLVVTKEFIEKHNINMVVHGDDFDENKINSYYKDAIDLNKLQIIPYTNGISTTDIINRILTINCKSHKTET